MGVVIGQKSCPPLQPEGVVLRNKRKEMHMQQELKKMVFMTIEDHLSLKEFESWLYGQEDLSNQMSDDFILGLFTFNYNQNGAKDVFRETFLSYFDKEEFMLWKIKANLQDLMDGKDNRDRILKDFYRLGDNGFSFLQTIGYYIYDFEELEYSIKSETDIIADLKKDAKKLLLEIESQEKGDSDFRISTFGQTQDELRNNENPDKSQWWEF